MRKVTVGLLITLSFCGIVASEVSSPKVCFAQPAEIEVNDEANILYQEAIELKKQNQLEKAVEAYHKAMRIDRAILAFDDDGLIEALKNDCQQKLEKNPNDVKVIETLAFVSAVCFSDYQTAIKNYEKVIELVTDDSVKEKTQILVERLKATSEAQQKYQSEAAQEMREERLKSWSEMERVQRFGEESAEAQEKARQLAESYKEKDSLKNRVPQLEKELKDLNEEYEKANRMWYTLKDDMYYRRRRRLKDDIAAKEQQLTEAREQLEEVEESTSQLEREVNFQKQQTQDSPVKTYDNYKNPSDDSGSSSDEGAGVAAPPSNDYGAPPEPDSGTTETQEPLPAVDNPDFPADRQQPEVPANETAEEREKRLKDLINNL